MSAKKVQFDNNVQRKTWTPEHLVEAKLKCRNPTTIKTIRTPDGMHRLKIPGSQMTHLQRVQSAPNSPISPLPALPLNYNLTPKSILKRHNSNKENHFVYPEIKQQRVTVRDRNIVPDEIIYQKARSVRVKNNKITMNTILHDLKMDRYKELFQREEIDLETFYMLKLKDFQQIGVFERDCDIFLRKVNELVNTIEFF